MFNPSELDFQTHPGTAPPALSQAWFDECPLGIETREPEQEDPEKVKLESDLWYFVQIFWPVMRPEMSSIDGPGPEAIAKHLQSVSQGLSSHILIEVEPKSGKSDLLNLWAAWEWTRRPYLQHITGVHLKEVLFGSAEALMRLLESPEYRKHWPHIKRGRHWKPDYISITGGGGIQLLGRRESIQGLNADRIRIDDLISDNDIDSPTERARTMRWLNGSLRSRGIAKGKTPTVSVAQRLHVSDPHAQLMETEGKRSSLHAPTGFMGTWDRLILQTEFTCHLSDTALTRLPATDSRHWHDPRRVGEMLRSLWTPEEVARAKQHPEVWYPQHQQTPRSGKLAIWKRHWWRFWHRPGHPLPPVAVTLDNGDVVECPCEALPEDFDREFQSWDLKFAAHPTGSKVSGQYWAQTGAKLYFIEHVNRHLSFTESVDAIKAMSAAHPRGHAKIIENKANGPAAMDQLRNQITGIDPYEPRGSKGARAASVSPLLKAGNVYLPHPLEHPWVRDFLDMCDLFTGAPREEADPIDAASQALDWAGQQLNITADDKFEEAGGWDWGR